MRDIWAYERVVWKLSLQIFWQHKGQAIVVAVIAAAVTVIGTLILHTVGVGDAVDWRALVASGIIGFAVAITIFFWTRVEVPAEVHKEQT